jgi:UDP-sulfoquinovose synthase
VKVIVLGGDGFCGWPCAVNLAEQNHDVIIVDNLSRCFDNRTTFSMGRDWR